MMFCLGLLERGLATWQDHSSKIQGMIPSHKTLVFCGNLQAGWTNLNETLTETSSESTMEIGSSNERQFDWKGLLRSDQWNSFKQKSDDFCSLHQSRWVGFELQIFQLGDGMQPISWTFRPKKVAP